MTFYPNVNDASVTPFRVVLSQLRDDPAYLDAAECPYPEAVKAFFAECAGAEAASAAPELKRPEDLERQIEMLIHDLDAMAKTLTTKDHAEKLAYFKTKTSLLEKTINLKERVLNFREMGEFQAIVLRFLNESCSKDQISTLMHALRHLKSMEVR